MQLLDLIQSENYPYHLTWEEINDPGIVIQSFLKTWELPYCRILLWKYYERVKSGHYKHNQEEYTEIKKFLNELERVIEAIYIIRLQFKETEGRGK